VFKATAPSHEDVWGSGDIAPQFLTWNEMEVSGLLHVPITLFQGEQPWCPSDRRLGEPQSRSGRFGEEKNLFPLPEKEPEISAVQSVAQ
jgi:hypothetical protein